MNYTVENSRLEDVDIRNMICCMYQQKTFCYRKYDFNRFKL